MDHGPGIPSAINVRKRNSLIMRSLETAKGGQDSRTEIGKIGKIEWESRNGRKDGVINRGMATRDGVGRVKNRLAMLVSYSVHAYRYPKDRC